jgi:fermentation-respiration switch protein FrsA (DUF1100 family)
LEQYPFEQIYLHTEDGIELAGYYYANPARKTKTAVLIHGHSSSGFEGYGCVGLKYIRHGYNILLMDNRACGNSEGKWCTFGLLERKDTLQWVQYLAKENPKDEMVIHGTSLGGATACMLSEMALPDQVKAIVSDCAYANIRKQLEYSIQKTMHVPYQLVLPQTLWWFHQETGLSVDDASPLEAVKHAKVPMLFIHGEEDRYVKKENALALYDACTSEKKLLLIPGAGHAAAHYVGKEKYEGPLFQFLDQYIKEEE